MLDIFDANVNAYLTSAIAVSEQDGVTINIPKSFADHAGVSCAKSGV